MKEDFIVVATVLRSPSMPTLPDDTRNVFLPSGPVEPRKLATPLNFLSDVQFGQIYAGVVALRSAYSSELIGILRLRITDRGDLASRHVFTDDNLALLDAGGAMIALVSKLDLKSMGRSGRPHLSTTQLSFRDMLAIVVARIDVLGALEEDNDDHYEEARAAVAALLEPHQATLFNLNSHHEKRTPEPARNWCEREGGEILARFYGVDPAVLEPMLERALRDRIAQQGFAAAVRQELDLLRAIGAWASAHKARREGERSRADTIKRLLDRTIKIFKRNAAAGDPLAGDLEEAQLDVRRFGVVRAIDRLVEIFERRGIKGLAPPRMHSSVRAQLVAQRWLERLSPEMMVELSILLGPGPGAEVFLSRLHLAPVFGVAAIAGQLALRRQPVAIADTVTAGGCVALEEMKHPAFTISDPYPRRDPEIEELHRRIEAVLMLAGVDTAEVAAAGRHHIRTGEAVTIHPAPGPLGFFTG